MLALFSNPLRERCTTPPAYAGWASRQKRTTSVAMVRLIALVATVGPLALGCDSVGSLLSARTTSVVLFNNGDYPIEVELFFDEDQNVIEDLIDDVGSKQVYTIQPGQSARFSRDCDELQALQIRRAKLQVIGVIGPETSSRIQRDGTNFNCGDQIEVTFDHSAVLIDFNVTIVSTDQIGRTGELLDALGAAAR